MDELTVLTFKWRPPPGYRSAFGPEQVNTLQRMVARHYRRPHRFVCVTDDPAGISDEIEVYELWPDLSNLRNPSGFKNPSCYRRLRVFARNAGSWLGPRFVCLDLGCVITGDLEPLWDVEDNFRIWRSTTSGNPYNGSMFMLRSGARPQIWEDFDPMFSPSATRRARFYGSDQAWIAYRLGAGEAVWTPDDGVHSYRNEVQKRGGALPPGARVVFFHGRVDPWSPEAQRLPWVREHYR